ncbi:MAG: HAD family hydrolase [Clostridia bacterium]|nr:HAD family hydrolase [Clostridia bacterium]
MNTNRLVIFDLDGTLFRTETVDIEAFNNALAVLGYATRSEKEILDLIGLTLDSICEALLGTNDQGMVEKFRAQVIEFEEKAIAASGKLYPGVTDFLKRLQNKGYTLCICSNGNEEYVTAICNKFGFNSVFQDIWFERKGITKKEAVSILKKKYNAEKFVMVGDRLCDIEAGKLNMGFSIGVTYGFGGNEAEEADFKADSIQEVEKAIYKVFEA